jgi:transcriptional regulator
MFRKDLIDLLLDRPMSIPQIARLVGEKPKDVVNDVEHLIQSLKHMDYVLVVTPAQCRKCGFEFSMETLRKPSKCPKCFGTWLNEPQLIITRK